MIEDLIIKYESMEKPELPLDICNVCAIANLRCHLNLSHIAQNGIDVEYDSFLNVLKTKLRQPKVGLAQFWSNGKMSVFGCDNIENAKKGCRILARRIKKLGYNAKFENFQVVNILTKLQLPFKVRIHEMVSCDPLKFMYEPELDPNLYFYPNPKNRGRKFNEYRAMAKITSNGKVTIHSMTMDEARIIGDNVFKLSVKYIMEEIVDPCQLIVVAADSSSTSRTRKRVVVKTYVESSESTAETVGLVADSSRPSDDNGSRNGTSQHTASESLNGLFSEPFYVAQPNYKVVNELSLIEAQQVLDDLLN